MPFPKNLPTWTRYGIAVIAVTLTFYLIDFLPAAGGWKIGGLILPFFTITVVTFWLGRYPGMLTTALTVLLLNTQNLQYLWFKNPQHALLLNTILIGVSAFTIFSVSYQEKLLKQLVEAHQDLKLAQSVGQIGSWRYYELNKAVVWSAETYRIFGVPIGKTITYETFLLHVHPDDRLHVDKAWQAALSGQAYDVEHRIIVGGQTKWIREKASLVYDENGRISGGFGITQDITRFKNTMQALQTLNERYELVLQGAMDGIWDWDVVTNQVHYSDRWKTLRGYTRNDDLHDPSPWRDNIHPDDEERVMAAMDAHFAQKTPAFQEEYRIRCKDGAWKWILDRGLAKRDEKGKVIRMAGSEKDITARKKTEMDLRQREQELELIMNLTPNLVAYLSPDFRYVRINKTYESWWNKTPEQILGHEVREIVGEEAWLDLEPYMQRARSGESVSFDYHSPSGRWVHVDYVPDVAASGAINGVVVNVANITQLKLAEQQLIEQDKQLNLIIDQVPALVSYLDTDLRYMRVNVKYEDWYNLPATDIIGRKVTEIIHERTWALAKPHLEAALKGQSARFESLILKQDTERWVNATFAPDFNANGEVKGIVVHVADITDYKKAVQEILEKENQLQLVMDMMPAIISYMDTDFRYLRVNKVYEQWFGMATNDIVGRTVPEIIGEKAWRTSVSEFERARRGETVSFEHYVTYENGVSRWTKKNIVPIKDESGVVKALALHVEDISEQKNYEQALIEKENFLNLIINAMPALVAYVSPDYRYVRANKTYEKWLGIPIEQIVGSEIKDIIGETGWHKIKPYLERAMLGEEIHYDFLMPYKTGKPRWIHAHYVPDLDFSGQVKGLVALVVDISEIRTAQQQINLLNEKLQHRIGEMQAIFDAAPIGLAITEDPQGLSIRGNRALEEMINLASHSELSLRGVNNKPYRVFKNGEELPIDSLPMQRGIRGESITNQMLDIQDNDGRMFSVLVNVRPLLNQDNSVRGAIGAFLDVTAITTSESALRQSQEQLRLAQQAGALGIFDYNLVTGELQWDQRLRELWGLETDTPITFDTCKLGAYPDDRLKISNAMARALDPNGPGEYKVEYRILRPADQRTFWIAAYGTTTFANGKPERLVGFAQDISERKLAEEKLRDTELRVTLALEELNAGYWDWDLESNQVYFSPVWKQQLGYAEHEIENRYEEWENRLHPDDREMALDTIRDYLAGILPEFELDLRLLHKDNTYRNIHSRGALIRDDNNKISRMVGIHLDVTNYIKAKELEQQQKLLDESAELFVASQTAIAIAHDLNQPLNAVSHFADAAVAMLKTGNAKPDMLAYALENCSEQAHRAGRVIPQLIAVLNKSEQVDINEAVDINALIQETVTLLKNLRLYDQFSPQLHLESGLPPVRASRLQLQKVLYNLIQNGFDAMVDSGKSDGILSVSVSRQAGSTDYLEIIIKDQGKGVTDKTQLKKIFQPFYSTKKAGLGIGLAICHDLIRAHGGEIWAEQNPDCGLSLHFTLPVIE